jgi:FkbM family methyltransferase
MEGLTKIIEKAYLRFGHQLGFNSSNINQRTLKKITKDIHNKVVFDVGANIGEFSQSIRRIKLQNPIVAIEPQPECRAEFENRVEGNFVLINMAVAEKTGKAILSRNMVQDRKAYLQKFSENDYSSKNFIEVSVATLDSICDDLDIPEIGLLKIDTEGKDYKVLKGAEKLLKENRIGCIIFEISHRMLLEGVQPSQVQNYLNDYGFDYLYRSTPHFGLLRVKKLKNDLVQTQNIIATKEKI